MARNIAVYKGQTRPSPPMSMEGKGFVYKIVEFPKKDESISIHSLRMEFIREIISNAQKEAFELGGNAIIDAEIKDTQKDGLFMREFSGTVVKFTKIWNWNGIDFF